MIYYISDLHYFHKQALTEKDLRDFASLEELHTYMIRQWNTRVKPDDLVIVLGDFSNGTGQQTNELLKQLNGRIAILRGNHDDFLDDPDFDASRLEWADTMREMDDDRYIVVLCHYPVMFYNKMFKTMEDGRPMTYMLYGHLHNSMDEGLMNQYQNELRQTKRYMFRTGQTINTPSHMINCFCMFSDYVPLTLEEWIALDKQRRKGIV